MKDETINWEELFQNQGAIWQHDGKPDRPHVILHSGNHSGTYIESGLIEADPQVLSGAAHHLVKTLMSKLPEKNNIDFVVAPAIGGIALGFEVALNIILEKDKQCFFAYTKETKTEEVRVYKLNIKIKPNSKVLLVDDVLTTGDSLRKTAKEVESAGGELLPFVSVLINRSGKQKIDGREVVSLITKETLEWKPEDCPLCLLGSEAILPGEEKNWSRLNARY